MKKISVIAAVAGMVCLLSFRSIADWIEYNSTEGNYKISMPAVPTEQIKKMPTVIGEITMYIALLESVENDENLIYMCAYSEYPADKISSDMNKEGIDRFFIGAAEGGAKKMNGKVKTISESKYNNFPARVVVMEAILEGEKFLVLQKLILVKNKFYMLQTFTRPENEDNASAKKFFDSFALTNK